MPPTKKLVNSIWILCFFFFLSQSHLRATPNQPTNHSRGSSGSSPAVVSGVPASPRVGISSSPAPRHHFFRRKREKVRTRTSRPCGPAGRSTKNVTIIEPVNHKSTLGTTCGGWWCFSKFGAPRTSRDVISAVC